MALNMIERDNANDPLVPTPVSSELVAELPGKSTALTLGRVVPMSSKTSRQPVLSALPEAYWVNGDSGLKDTSNVDFKNAELVAEELAVIVPIPEAYLDDSQVPIWSVVRPLVAEAIGRKLDQAVLFGTGKPVTWTSPAIVPGAIAAGNKVAEVAGTDLGVTVAELGRMIAQNGFVMSGFAGEPGLGWKLVGQRTTDGGLIYGPSISAGQPGTLYGLALNESNNGAWDPTAAVLVGGDFKKAIIGVRQDITYKVFTEGVITDGAGKVLLNLMQQDSVALRVVMRVGYTLPVPATALDAAGFPFGVVQPAAPAAASTK